MAPTAEIAATRAHRELAGRPEDESESLVNVLQELHSALFGVSLDGARTSALERAQAAETVDLITSSRSTDVALDWWRVEDHLQAAYRSLVLDAQRQDQQSGLRVVNTNK